ncbi:MAG: phosphoribosylaminoimidazolecarboxamide formyltransferase [Candidatus Saccharibacteria bacterium]|nr:phosphoribosylaminoimidazolecarboxamide formyltransferase [Candidatus Saccharibacteria bacterium]
MIYTTRKEIGLKKSDYTIATLASHSSLQILKGAKDEGFATLAIVKRGSERLYKSFNVADEIIVVDDFSELKDLDEQLSERNAILIPHGSFVAACDLDDLKALKTNYFGNRNILTWEADRIQQRKWLGKADLLQPKIFKSPDDIEGPVIVKFFGAAGGKGYFLTHSKEDFERKIAEHAGKEYILQEYVVGTPVYVHFFHSSLTGELEIMGFDKRYESNVDSVGRVAAKEQIELSIETSYTIVGNMGLVVRESLLPMIYAMGERVIAASKEIDGIGLFGPFCLETIITPDLKMYVFEISARIVAGTNPYINGSPYTDLRYDVPMSTGRRIAREIKHAIASDELEKVFQ